MSQVMAKHRLPDDVLFDTSGSRDIVEFMLQEAKAKGATASEAGLSVEAGLSITVRLGEVETIEHNRDKSLGVTVYFGQRKGSASTTDFTRQAVSETVSAVILKKISMQV